MNPNIKKIHCTRGTSDSDLKLTYCGKWLSTKIHTFTVVIHEATCKTCIRSMEK